MKEGRGGRGLSRRPPRRCCRRRRRRRCCSHFLIGPALTGPKIAQMKVQRSLPFLLVDGDIIAA